MKLPYPIVILMTILNVDDDSEDIDIFCEAVRDIDAGIICLAAKSAEEALQIFNSDIELPQYIFLDINYQAISGFKDLKFCRKAVMLSLTYLNFTNRG